MQPDKIDWKIIDLLSNNYLSNNEIARHLKISEGTVRRRIKILQSEGIMRIKALLDPDVLENKQLAIVAVSIAKAKLLDKKAKQISELKNVISVSIVSGQYDLLVEVLVDSNKGLVRFLTESLSTIEGITKTETFLILKSFGKFI